MTKTLVIEYTPRMERSATKSLLEYFENLVGKTSMTVEDIAAKPPPTFGTENLSAYYKKYYNKTELSPKEMESIKEFERLTKATKNADVVVVAYPMYNFSVPAAVKAYFDAILLYGETWGMENGAYVGRMKGKRALVITTSGGVYENPDMAKFDHSTTLVKDIFNFMGFSEVEIAKAEGLNTMPENKDNILKEAKAKLNTVVKKWYGKH